MDASFGLQVLHVVIMAGNIDVGLALQNGQDLVDYRPVILMPSRGIGRVMTVNHLPNGFARFELGFEPLPLELHRVLLLVGRRILLPFPHDPVSIENEELYRSGGIGVVGGREAPALAVLRVECLGDWASRVVVIVVAQGGVKPDSKFAIPVFPVRGPTRVRGRPESHVVEVVAERNPEVETLAWFSMIGGHCLGHFLLTRTAVSKVTESEHPHTLAGRLDGGRGGGRLRRKAQVLADVGSFHLPFFRRRDSLSRGGFDNRCLLGARSRAAPGNQYSSSKDNGGQRRPLD